MLYFPVVCASVWCAISIEMVWETAHTITIVCAVSAAAALAMAIAVGYARGRRLERRMAAELDARWAQLAERDAGDAARRELLNWRLAELQTLVDRLLADRQAETRKDRHLVVVPDAEAPTRH